jgi:D-alanine transfer protein
MIDGQNQPLEQTPHLAPALTALVLGIVALTMFGFYARSLEHRSIAALAADEAIIERLGKLAPVKNQGIALLQAALLTGDLLPVYGSSELNVQTEYNRPFHSTNLFRDRPTGFTIFPVGMAGTTCLNMLQKLAAVGPELQGRKLVVSVTPFWFFERLTARPEAYAGNFSDLHAGDLAFNPGLSLQLRQDAARRMLKFPVTVANRPLLRFALENLADGSPLCLACYDAVLPLGLLHSAILRYQDHWTVVRYLWKHPLKTSSPISPRHSEPLDWVMLHEKAKTVHRAHSNNNEFGMDNEKWESELRQETVRLRHKRSDKDLLDTMEKNQEWVDLELLLRGLNELGVQPLVLSMPIHGPWYDECGITYGARRRYYGQLQTISARYHVPAVDFADHDGDRSFTHDTMGHLAPDGLVNYSEVFDRFFHDAIRPLSELPVQGGERSKP